MNPIIKQQWVSALRSGNYYQIAGKLKVIQLNNGNAGHCSLGVLCEILIDQIDSISNFSTEDIVNGFEIQAIYYEVDGEMRKNSATLPPAIEKLAQLYMPIYINPDALNSKQKERLKDNYIDPTGLITLNDLNDSGISFEELADIIEKTL